jgi:hypothetical protein
MAGFASMDDFISEVTTNGKFWRQDFNKLTGVAFTAGRCYDLSLSTGNPIQQLYAGTNLTFTPTSDTDGKGIWHGGNVTPDTKHLVNIGLMSTVATAVPAIIELVDVLGYYPLTTNTITTAQTLTNTLTLPRYTDGAGVQAYIVATTTMGAGTPNITISYTNQAGVSGRTIPVTVSAVTTAVQGHIVHSDPSAGKYFPFLPLQSGDTGIRSIQSITLSATMTSGSMALVLCKPITSLPLTTAGVMAERNLMTQLPSLPRIYDGANLNMLFFTASATVTGTPFIGYIEAANG